MYRISAPAIGLKGSRKIGIVSALKKQYQSIPNACTAWVNCFVLGERTAELYLSDLLSLPAQDQLITLVLQRS